MTPEQAERYRRWENYRVTQLSFAINLFLSFAVASLAYALNLKLSNKGLVASQLVAVIICWAISATFGCIATVSKLLDYRYTARKIKDGGPFNEFMAKGCGPVTWALFWVQIFTYSIGAYLFISAVIDA